MVSEQPRRGRHAQRSTVPGARAGGWSALARAVGWRVGRRTLPLGAVRLRLPTTAPGVAALLLLLCRSAAAQGVIPAKPDAWIWLGDIAYLDVPPVDCTEVKGYPECSCTISWLKTSSHQCNAGEVDAARRRWIHAVGAGGRGTG